MKKRNILIFFSVVLSCCIGLSIYLFTDTEALKNQRAEEHALREEISNMLGVPPSWDSITEYVDCVILAYGEPREKILRKLEAIPGYLDYSEGIRFDNNLDVEIRFRGPVVPYVGHSIGLVFDETDSLIQKYSLIGISDNREMVCP